MRSFFHVLPFIAMTALCWGNYGPLMHEGQFGMDKSSFRPFICVGMAYFLIAVVVPALILWTRGEKGNWTIRGTAWSLIAGAVGAIGALGIILAFKFRGSPVYVMPLVFGLAPVVNTFVSMLVTRSYKEARPLFYGGVIIVALGAAGVMFFKPAATDVVIEPADAGPRTTSEIVIKQLNLKDGSEKTWRADSFDQLENDAKLSAAYKLYLKKKGPTPLQFMLVLAAIGMTALCWGAYGVVLHHGQAKMNGSRMRPFLCVGLSYFGIAVVVPLFVLSAWNEPGNWLPDGDPGGIFWSLGAGAAGAIGALGIILAFNFGGKPIFVMPLVFGCAPVVNTFTTLVIEGTWGSLNGLFVGSLLMVIFGAVTVLIFAPRPSPPGKGKSKKQEKRKHKADAKSDSKPTSAPDDQSEKKAAAKSDTQSQEPKAQEPEDAVSPDEDGTQRGETTAENK